MIFEFIATFAAAFGFAGIALIIRHLVGLLKIKTPKWLIPLFAAIGIFTFQIHQEYFWFKQTQSKLPTQLTVVKKVEKTYWYKPWSYFKPQTVRFMAVDTQNIVSDAQSPNIKQIRLYMFERRMSTQQMNQLIDCQTFQRADMFKEESQNNRTWYPLVQTDPIIQSVCV